MTKINETEEAEIYRVISEALLSLCEKKPNNPVEFLSKKMLQLIGDNPDLIMKKKSMLKTSKIPDDVCLFSKDNPSGPGH